MPKTKEEVQKIVNANYQSVQLKELGVYEKVEVLEKSFLKEVKDLKGNLSTEMKSYDKEDKEITAKYKALLSDIVKKDNAHQNDVALKRETINLVFTKSMEDAVVKKTNIITELEKQVAKITKENKMLIKAVQAKYDEDIEASKKAIVYIEEKDVKDQNTFEAKIEDLKAKHEAKIAEIIEKEETKITKLTEASNKKVEKLQEIIQNEREKFDKKLAVIKPVFEEELAEIDEQMSDAKSEYESKHNSIRESADKRIAVREKHLHRAMDDNDSRSAKQHKKDIEKFRKEADKDLVLLRKKYNQDNIVKIDYRKKFIKENYIKFADLDKEYSKFREEKQHLIDDELIHLATDVENTKLDAEKTRAEEIDKFNNTFNETKIKQTEVSRQKELDLLAQADVQVKLQITLDKDNKVNEENYTQNMEEKAKELRDVEIEKIKDDTLSKDTLDVENKKLDNELEVAQIELLKAKKINDENEEIEHHNVQHKRHSSAKNEFLKYQQSLEPLYVSRAEEMYSYEQLEINNRFSLKISFLEKERKQVDRDFEVLNNKIIQVFENERVHFDKQIEYIAGEQQKTFDDFVELNEEKISVAQEKINILNPKTDRKERKALQDKLDNMISTYKTEKAHKEQTLNKSVGVFKEALKAAEIRKDTALLESKQLNDSEISRITKAVDIANSNKDLELEDSKTRLEETVNSIKDLLTKAATRNQKNTEENQTYLTKRVTAQESNISLEEELFNKSREALNNALSVELAKLEAIKQEALDKVTSNFKTEEQNLENFKNNIASNINNIEQVYNDAISVQNNVLQGKRSSVMSKFEQDISTFKATLTKQTEEFKNHLQEITQKINAEKQRFESEIKRIQKEYDQRLKEDITKIESKLQEDIMGIQ